ncbi:formimidoylglutamase [Comamonas flocculans]|uniref:Formimidoylglutamase n=1 Tax=Comamonas flocculans TaxID=2597701 RepID=A0A5B8RY23_9BURK|nr:formimidoylglutamase [Comamonas flocculans]QEA12757.1 formimidoylglutamase [Comamonas flocculans]
MTPQNPWQGRDDSGESGDTRRLHQIVRRDEDYGPDDAVLAGFASDAGVARNQGRAGAREAPLVARRALANLPAHALHAFWDAGDVLCEGDALEAAQSAQAQRVEQILGCGARLVVLGGGHETAWADYQGLREHLYGSQGPGGRLLVLNLDAHFDLRTSRPGNSGTPFDQILQNARERSLPVRYACLGISLLSNTPALYQRANELDVYWREDTEMQESQLDARLADIDRLLAEAEHVYLTIDTDVLPASVAPGVSAPAPYGVPLSVVEACLQRVKASGKLRLADIAEFNPQYDIDGHTARAVARLAWQLLQP